MKFWIKYAKKYWRYFCFAIVCLIMETTCDLMQPTLMSKIVDIGVKESNTGFIKDISALMIGITIVGAMSAVGRNIISSNVSQKFGAELRFDLFNKMQNISIENIDKYDKASLVTRLTNDVTQVQNFVNGLMRVFVKAPLLGIGSCIMAITISPKMSLIFFAIIPIVAMLIYANVKVGYPKFIKIQQSLDKLNSVIREYLVGIRVVKAFNRYDYETNRFCGYNEELSRLSTKTMRVMSIFTPGIALTVNLGIVVIIWIGGLKVNNKTMKVGEIIAFINYMIQILFSLRIISFVFIMYVKAMASFKRINEMFLEENDIEIMEKQCDISNEIRRIDFENIYFSYSNNSCVFVLKNITFSCVSGENIGIIGSIGSGKSTIASLIIGFYCIKYGSIKINNVDVNNKDMKKMRNKIAIVPQKTILFSGSIIDNIKWGNENATYEEIKKATIIAQADEFINSLPKGYDTIIGQDGVSLSGGQKQRISIARALVRDPKVLILDDCTSAVDAVTEQKIIKSIKEYAQNIICIIITQKVNLIKDADRIIVLDNGEIAGIGQHEGLIEECEVYKNIFQSQIGKEMMQYES